MPGDHLKNNADRVWLAPAKLNLFLHIVGRRPDGYHLLQTVFQFIDYCDRLVFHIRDDGRIKRCGEIPAVPAADDLTVRAAHLLQSDSGCRLGVDIDLDKRLPIGGGLGGGSSDAATTLVALNQLWGLRLKKTRLAALGLRLGADVPVFIAGQAAWAEGVGEQLSPLELPEPWFLVLLPHCHVSTAELFASSDLTRDCSPITIGDFLAGQGLNVFEDLVTKRYPVVGEMLRWLAQFGAARMTGTGGCVFATFNSENEAQRILMQLPRQWQGIVAKGLNRSPLYKVPDKVLGAP